MNTSIDRLRGTGWEQVARWRFVLGLFRLHSWAIAVAGAVATLVVIGIPTAIVDNPFFSRMMPVRPQDYIIWIMTGLLVGLIIGTYTLGQVNRSGGKVASGGFLSFLAVGCPICNKLILLLLGTSGALTYFAPAQLYLGIASLALLAWALHLRVQAIGRGCSFIAEQVESRDNSAGK
jgi:hypothetical protein